ncbi:uncharacterized protein K489DRAFT_381001 [Dissoconium aciculare CBS 342.82]|uniref:Uncharacterized protein n=1 Tax=Dissoconium aciculare CBS 342.82 TaxID=1314786 RepID=A0A6J3M445_9PEZI|nr:uncharacterized protein K489DRAFT_381001 [Dissoconium aciculare CBS 342.82]KAF1822254.1 hypothetical protein K489DRAFT_381001 [Dissoconium aciculare CBS 342.82]
MAVLIIMIIYVSYRSHDTERERCAAGSNQSRSRKPRGADTGAVIDVCRMSPATTKIQHCSHSVLPIRHVYAGVSLVSKIHVIAAPMRSAPHHQINALSCSDTSQMEPDRWTGDHGRSSLRWRATVESDPSTVQYVQATNYEHAVLHRAVVFLLLFLVRVGKG